MESWLKGAMCLGMVRRDQQPALREDKFGSRYCFTAVQDRALAPPRESGDGLIHSMIHGSFFDPLYDSHSYATHWQQFL